MLGLLIGLAVIPNNAKALMKDETVYSTLNSDGSLFKSSVVNHLYEANDDETKDVTKLKDILNVNGNETFTINGNDLTWKNKSKEIFYRGTTDMELPISTNVKYFLDDKEIDHDKLVGKSGNVKIEISFKNNDKHVTNINGYNEDIYTPFVVTVGSVISNKNASNIKVSNGKVVNTGSRNFIVSVASPGLYDSLGLDEFKDMDKVIISFDTDSYKKNSIYVVSSPKLIDSTDLDVFDKLDSVYKDVDSLSKNMDIINNGAIELESGAQKLASGSKEISDNLYTIANYMKSLEEGSYQLDSGLKQVIEALNQASNSISGDDGSINELNSLKQGNIDAINTLTNTNNTIKNTFNNYNIDIDNITIEQLQVVAPDLVTYKQSYDGNNKLIYLLGLNNGAIDATIKKSNETVIKINSLVNELKTSLEKIEAGSNKLYNSTTQIRNGIDKLYQGSVSLNNGANSMYNGTIKLRSGISTYNSSGIKIMASYVNEAKVYTNKLDELTKLTKQYKGFASDNSNSTTFVSVIK